MKKLAVILPTLFALCFAALCGCGGGEASLFYNALSWNAAGEGPYLVYDGETLLAETDVPAVLLPRAGGRELSLYGGAGGPRGELGSGINLGGGLSTNDAVDGADGVGFAGTPVILAGAVL